MLKIETALTALALLMAWLCPEIGSRWFAQIEKKFAAFASHRVRTTIIVGISALILRAALLPIDPIPEPVVHDEFGYLLAADTFAHGRLTNPTHPMWMHFESFSILQRPTYQCFAQPAQGLVLALGKLVFGHPFWGVWLSVGVMCSAITWALQAWLPLDWALLGGVLAVLRFGVFGYWADSYWGGAIGAIGGALVLGCLPRIQKFQRVRDAIILGLGLALLANSRPYEGFVFCIPFAIAINLWLVGKKRPPASVCCYRVILPLSIVVIITGAWMGYYFWRVTGSPLRMPYQLERQTYAAAPYLIWQHPPATVLVYHSEAMKQLYVDGEYARYKAARTPIGFVYIQAKKIGDFWSFFLGPVLSFPFLILLFTLPYDFSWRDLSAHSRFLLSTLAFTLVCMSAEIIFSPHYAAPLTTLILLLAILALRRVRERSISRHSVGVFLSRAVVFIVIAMLALRASAGILHVSIDSHVAAAWHQQNLPSFGRAEIIRRLQNVRGPILVLVHYGSKHSPFDEWVYNDADIDHAKVVWARDLGTCENEKLFSYFKSRNLFLLEADENPPALKTVDSAALDSCTPGKSSEMVVEGGR